MRDSSRLSGQWHEVKFRAMCYMSFFAVLKNVRRSPPWRQPTFTGIEVIGQLEVVQMK